ncbi:MAG: hypothetical protein EB127_07375 [Alphaproteobacteria bacterium]|nr:hypothetical protein [Alphaproteobacteria bacterium]
MKPTGAMSAPSQMSGGEVVRDAHGGSTHDAYGKGDQMIQPVAQPGMSQNAASTLQMKPSWAGVQMPTFDRGQMAEEVKAMFGGADDLSEEFVNKAANLYEARLLTNLQSITEQLTEQFSAKLVESVEQVASTLEEQIDNYLNYVVEQWMGENKLVVEQGLRTEIAENFINGLKELFNNSYIEVPQDKVNAFDEMATAIEALETRVNEEMERNVNLVNEMQDLKASLVFTEETEALSDLDAENVKKLVENLRFDNEESFRSNVQTLVEGYVKSKTSKSTKTAEPITDSTVGEDQTSEKVFMTESVKRYAEILGRTLKG